MNNRTTLQSLTSEELNILIAVQTNPLATYEELAEMAQVPKTSTYRILKKFEDPNKSPGYLRVKANLNLSLLQMEIFDVILQIDTLRSVQILREICKKHPYICYYTICYGKQNGFIIQFRIPIGNRDKIIEFCTILEVKSIINNFKIFGNWESTQIFSPQYKHWNSLAQSWDFDWNYWFNYPYEKNDDYELNKIETFSKNENILQSLTKKDIEIICEYMKNSRRKNIEIIESLKSKGIEIAPSLFSKVSSELKEKLIINYRAEIELEPFEITVSVLLIGKGTKKEIGILKKCFRYQDFPFYSTVKFSDYTMFLYLHIPPNQLSKFLMYLEGRLTKLDFYYIDLFNSKTFLIDPDCFSEEIKNWKQDKDFIIFEILNKVIP